ncbi:CopG family transcriptional regulator [Shewanella alkalitolerans]|uniref:CopG family transcriptional regulator n=1 Tax=Shewanella alkalitolerans TaxID=2864209 RepID=UPI001C65F29F|nr:CopG family transcriptional regulator [Shewanella alkalitolerans]QYJ98844.1 CopG family transcriptional regulator [Shewanella alkalitolerans]
MGLADLKKSSTQSSAARQNRKLLNISLDALIDDFIEDATHYAAGQPSNVQQMAEVIALETGFDGDFLNRHAPKVVPKGTGPYRKATFTLSESAIAHLAELASGCDVAKSKLIRFLIEHHYSLSESERQQKEQSIIVD